MKLIRCLLCNKVLGEVEGKAKIKCKMAGCHCMNVIDTDAGTQVLEHATSATEWKSILESAQKTENERQKQFAVDIFNNGFTQQYQKNN